MKIIKINPADNVAVAIEQLKAGETIDIEGQRITLNNDVPAGHKILLSDLVEGENVIKYGYPIGHLKENHKQGDWICHEHIQTNLAGLLDYEYKPVGKEELTNPAYEEWFPKEHSQRGVDCTNSGLCERHCQSVGREAQARSGISTVNCQLSTVNSPPHRGLSPQLWLFATL